MVRLVIVTGAGRSGTSTVAGALQRLGGVIPQPEVPTDERNPRGYYEPLWVAQFHKRWLNSVPVRTIDTRPDADRIAMDSLRPRRRERLLAWLTEQVEQAGADATIVVKETRAYFVYPLWVDVAAEVGVDLVSLTMLRHPTQVVRSRDSAYLSHESDEVRLEREVANVAAWANSVFITERATRGNARAFVPYGDLLADWRAALTRACDQIGMPTGDLAAPHAIDEFITPKLNRSSDAWDGLRVPDWLRELGESTWTAAQGLVERPHDETAVADLEALASSYEPRYRTSVALATDVVAARTIELEREIRTLRERLETKNETIAKLRRKLSTQEGGR